jgi:hypothetical protein
MCWQCIESHWPEFKIKAKKNWDQLTNKQLDFIAGNRENFVITLQLSYGLPRKEADYQLLNWEIRQFDRKPYNRRVNIQTIENKLGRRLEHDKELRKSSLV